MPYLKPFLFIASLVIRFKPISFPWQSQIKTCILFSPHARRLSEFAWLADTYTYRRYESCWTGRSGSYSSSVTLLCVPPPTARIPSEILHSLHHPNYYSFCNLTMLAYALSLNIIEHATPKLCQCRNGLWAWTNTIRFEQRTWLSSLSPDGQNWC